MIKSNWKLKEHVSEDLLKKLKQETGYSTLFLKLCLQRGLETKEAINQFIHPQLEQLHDPFKMHDMERAVDRINKALMNGEKITIYGDYDADGVTSVVTLLDTLNMLGANVNYFIPHRVRDGYGPNLNRFQEIVQAGTELIITVDNGVAGHEAVEWAMSQGVDVIITDHHELPQTLPNAYAIVHPMHPTGDYPFKELAGVGVAFKLASAILGEVPFELLDLVAVGTIADLVSVTDENRVLIQSGLKVLNQTDRVGLEELFSVCNLQMGEIDEQAVGFQIAPRINAAGRLEDASLVVELLTTWDENEAKQIAEKLDEINENRKQLVNEISEEASQILERKQEPTYVVAQSGWHEGVLGIVASRLVEQTKKPMIVLTIDPETGLVKGSARGVEGFNLFEELNELSHFLERFGGHEMAAGLSLSLNNLDDFIAAFSQQVMTADLKEPTIWIDEVAELSDISVSSLEEVNLLKPFGTNNSSPVFAVQNAQLKSARAIGMDGTHLKLMIEQDSSELDIIALQLGHLYKALIPGETIDVLGSLEINEWQGKRNVQMMLHDFSISKPLIYDERKMQLQPSDFSDINRIYVVYDQVLANQLKKRFSEHHFYVVQDIQDAEKFIAKQPITFVDCPPNLEIFIQTIQENEEYPWTLYFYKGQQKYLNGLPSRIETATVYKFIATHQNIPLADHGLSVSKFLKIPLERLQDILKMFIEAGFVIIDEEVLNIVQSPKKVDLTKTKTYHQLLEELNAEKYLIYSSFNELKQQIINWLKE